MRSKTDKNLEVIPEDEENPEKEFEEIIDDLDLDN